jgi:hypothetical protein
MKRVTEDRYCGIENQRSSIPDEELMVPHIGLVPNIHTSSIHSLMEPPKKFPAFIEPEGS